MNKYDTNQYVKILDKLPKEIKDVVASSETVEHIWKIGQNHNLHIDKLGIMSDTAYDVMMGIVSTKNFVDELAKNLEVSVLEASTLARDIDENVFKPIKEIMVTLYANGAPNRPSSSLVQFYEEDENHPSLEKNALLKEIEDPSEVVVKKEVVQTVSKVVSLSGNEEDLKNKIEIPRTTNPQSKQVEIYHEEIVSPVSEEIKVTPTQPTIPQAEHPTPANLVVPSIHPLNSSDLLNKIAGMKLNKTFVMPKKEENEKFGTNLSSPASGANGGQDLESSAIKPSLGIVNPIKPETNNKPEAPKPVAATIDPYREKI